MKVKVSSLSGNALDWAVAKCEGYKPHSAASVVIMAAYLPSCSWAQGGLIIEREKIETYYHHALEQWAAKHNDNLRYGPTPLIAAMRCYVASKLGEEVEVPEEVLK